MMFRGQPVPSDLLANLLKEETIDNNSRSSERFAEEIPVSRF